METFINDIYIKSMLGQYLKQTIYASRTGDFILKRNSWDCYASLIESVNSEQSKNSIIEEMMHISKEIKELFLNDTVFADMIELSLLPLFNEYISNYTGIDVDDGKWEIISTPSGFLTITSLDNSQLLHSQIDPMWEAQQCSNYLYSPYQTDYYILGGGLGYLAFQIWRRSERTAKIHIYVTDNNIYQYSKMYGVLDWIEPSSLDTIITNDKEETIKKFLENENNGIVISEPKDIYNSTYGERLQFKKKNNQLLYGEAAKIATINYSYNKDKGQSIDILPDNKNKEWIIVASGPSLKDNIDFLKQNHGKKTIITVSSALKFLLDNKIQPDYCTVADPYDTLMPHILGIENLTSSIPLIANYIANCNFIQSYKGNKYYVTTKEDAKLYNITDIPKLYYGGTVSSLALAIAYYFKAKKIYLIGLDLGYPGGKHYASNDGHDNNEELQGTHTVPSVDGKMVGSTVTFDAFRTFIESQISKNPDTPVINLSKHGALIKGTISH